MNWDAWQFLIGKWTGAGGGEQITIRFEMAPPDQPDAYTLYTEGWVRRE